MAQWRIGVPFLLVFLAASTAGLIMPILPLYIGYGLGGSVTTAGLLLSLVSAPQLLARIPFSLLSDRIGRKPLMIFGLLMYGLAYTAYSLVQSLPQLTVFILLHGSGMAAYWPASMAYLGDLTQANQTQRSGRIIGAYTTTFGAAYTVGSFFGGYTVENFGYNADFHLAALLGFLGGIIAFIGVKDIIHSQIRVDSAIKTNQLSLHRRLRVLASNDIIVLALASILLSATILPAVQVFFPLYAKSLGTGEALIGLAMMVNTGGSAIARFPGGQLSERLNHKVLLGAAFLMLAAGIFFIPFTTSFSMMLLCLAIVGFGSGVILSVTLVMVIDAARPSERGFVIGLQGTTRHVGRVSGPIIMGVIAASQGLTAPFIMGALFGIAGLISILFLLRLIKR